MGVANMKMSVGRLFWEQVALNFIVVAVLIALGALLTFKVMGEEYSACTVVGFFATVFFAFIVFLPAGTLFAARAEVAKDKVEVRADEKTGALAPIANPTPAIARSLKPHRQPRHRQLLACRCSSEESSSFRVLSPEY